jgi:hypothetical protein
VVLNIAEGSGKTSKGRRHNDTLALGEAGEVCWAIRMARLDGARDLLGGWWGPGISAGLGSLAASACGNKRVVGASISAGLGSFAASACGNKPFEAGGHEIAT